MGRQPNLAASTIESGGRPGKTITRAVPDRFGYQGNNQKEKSPQ
jgi:hypothetical protein